MDFWYLSMNSLNLLNPNSPVMEHLNFFHDWVMIFVMSITISLLYMLIVYMKGTHQYRLFSESQDVELVWTLAPCVVLMMIGMPSLRLLYLLDEAGTPALTLKTIGHQWYWSYEYSDLMHKEFDAYMVKNSNPRLLMSDNRTILPYMTPVRVLISAADVLHSWTIPSLGIKADAVPGRLNQLTLFASRPGIFYGQCSEICGSNHSFMPITMEFINKDSFLEWAS
uniref:Cytochrome c oxidase subunit 2 n=1 Tax=Paraspadella gotoi TaxID=34758 RepID=Q6E0W2_PARGO|nr:cytochrome c oxidase subunit II [Paraspadella gotoi]AAT12170.1 cytochrome oxidase subunit II [Paraspadella gotoi]